jgi:hypothetical protein
MHLCRFLLLFAVGTDDRYCYIRLLHELQRRTPEAQAYERGGKQALQLALLLLAATSNALAVGHGLGGISNPAARRFQISPPLPITNVFVLCLPLGTIPISQQLSLCITCYKYQQFTHTCRRWKKFCFLYTKNIYFFFFFFFFF